MDEYLTTHTRLQTAIWCEYFLAARIWVRKDEVDDDTDSMDEYLRSGYPSSERDTTSPPEDQTVTQNNPYPYGPEFFAEMKRRFYAQEHKKRTPREQYEIDRTKAAWAVRLTPRK